MMDMGGSVEINFKFSMICSWHGFRIISGNFDTCVQYMYYGNVGKGQPFAEFILFTMTKIARVKV